jgi:hypothetical protein
MAAKKANLIKDFEGGQTTNTQLTPNSNATATASGDVNDTTQCSFLYNNLIPYWSPSVGSGNTTATLGMDRGNAVVTFMKGLTVTYIALAGKNYTLTLSGNITDSGTIYQLNKSLGIFTSRVPPPP